MASNPKDRGARLDSWKAIADYLGRDVRTLLRWEKEKGLPVHRVPGGKRQAVFAFVQELNEWLVKSGDSSSEVGSAQFEHDGHSEFESRSLHTTYEEWQVVAGVHSKSSRPPVFDEPRIAEHETRVLANRQHASLSDRFDPGSTTQLVRGLEGIGGLAWSEDGRRIVFSSPGGGPSDIGGGNLWEVTLARPNRPERLPFGHDAVDLAVNYTSHRLAFKQVHININIWRLDLTQPQARAQKVVVSSRKQNSPNYSPDGKQIAFDSDRSGNYETWVSDADGSNAVQLSSFGIKLTGTPRWSPDGKAIAFDSRIGGEANIYLVDPRGGVPRKLDIDIRDNTTPTWSHDGAWIYFTSGFDAASNPSVWKVPSKGGHAIRISKGDAFTPQESPDDQYVYFCRNWWLWRVKTDGTDEQQVQGMPELDKFEAWTPFGQGIYFFGYTDEKPAIKYFDLNTKEVRTVYFMEKPAPIWMGGLPISSDGKWLLFAQLDESSSELMLVDNWN